MNHFKNRFAEKLLFLNYWLLFKVILTAVYWSQFENPQLLIPTEFYSEKQVPFYIMGKRIKVNCWETVQHLAALSTLENHHNIKNYYPNYHCFIMFGKYVCYFIFYIIKNYSSAWFPLQVILSWTFMPFKISTWNNKRKEKCINAKYLQSNWTVLNSMLDVLKDYRTYDFLTDSKYRKYFKFCPTNLNGNYYLLSICLNGSNTWSHGCIKMDAEIHKQFN